MKKLVYLIVFFLPLIFLPALNNSFELPKMAFFRIMVLWMLLCYTIQILRSKAPSVEIYSVFKKRYLKVILILSIALFVVSTLFSIAPEMSFWGSYYRIQGVNSFIHYFLFFLLLSLNFHKDKDWEGLFKALFLGFFFVILLAALQKFGVAIGGYDLEEYSLGRIFSTLGHANYYASYILLVIFPILSYLLISKKKWPYILLFVLGLLALAFTGSKAAFLGFFLALIFFLLAGKVFIKDKYWLPLAVVTIATPLLLISLANLFPDSPAVQNLDILDRLVINEDNSRSINSRIVVWKSSLPMLDDRIFTGHGLETFSTAIWSNIDPEIYEYERIHSVPDRLHNTFLQLFFDFGISAPLLYLFAFFYLYYLSYKRVQALSRRKKILLFGVLSSLSAVFVNNLFSFSTTVHFALTAFLLSYLLYLLSDKTIKKSFEIRAGKFGRTMLHIFISLFVISAVVMQNLMPVAADYLAKSAIEKLGEGDLISASWWLSVASFIHPKQDYYYNYLSSISSPLGGVETAEYYASLARDFSSNDAYYYYMLGQILHPDCVKKGENCLEEEKAYRKAFELAPNYPLLHYYWAAYYLDRGDCEGLPKIDRYMSLIPDSKKTPGTDEYRLFLKHNPEYSQALYYQESYKEECSAIF